MMMTTDDARINEAKTRKQDDIILEIFEYYPERRYTPADIENIVRYNYGRYWPITSIRRAITTLTKAGKLRKTKELQRGNYGKMTHCWIIR